jgi:glycosyltransferase involved in cell wall biosynthesis
LSQPAAVPIVRLITRLNIGGPSIQAITLTRALEKYGYRTELVHGSLDQAEGDMRYLLEPDLKATFVPALRRPVAPFDDVRALAATLALLRRVRPAILHTHMAKAGTLGRVAAQIYNRLPGHRPLRVVHTYHGHVLDAYFPAITTRAVIAVERLLAPAADRLIAISDRIRKELVDQYRIGQPSQYATIPLGFDLARFAAIDAAARRDARRTLQIAPSAPVVTTVGRLTAIKNHELFLRAAVHILVAVPTVQFMIVGDGEERAHLERLARDLGIAANVRFVGWRRDLEVVYGATDVFLLTSRNEGTPVALIEAMASAVAGVANDVGGVPDVIDAPDYGTLVAGEEDAAARAVIALLRDDDRRARIGVAARAHVLARYGQDRLVRQIAGLYDELLRVR